jgi:hypothetical protein
MCDGALGDDGAEVNAPKEGGALELELRTKA